MNATKSSQLWSYSQGKTKKINFVIQTLIVPVPHTWHSVESHPHCRDDDEDERDERYSLRQRQI